MLLDVLAASMFCSSNRWLKVHGGSFDDCKISGFTDDDTSVGEETVSSPNAVDSPTPGMKTVPLLACVADECRYPPASRLCSLGAAKIDWGSFIEAEGGSFEAAGRVSEANEGHVVNENGGSPTPVGEERAMLEDQQGKSTTSSAPLCRKTSAEDTTWRSLLAKGSVIGLAQEGVGINAVKLWVFSHPLLFPQNEA